MANRRSLSAALDMSPEQRAFISGSASPSTNDQPRSETPQSAEPDSQSNIGVSKSGRSLETDVAQMPEPRRLPASTPNPRKRTDKLLPDDDSIVWIAQMLVPLTTRLHPTTAAALKRAGIEQKLRGQKPGTVQEIAEGAIANWLRQQGYLD